MPQGGRGRRAASCSERSQGGATSRLRGKTIQAGSIVSRTQEAGGMKSVPSP